MSWQYHVFSLEDLQTYFEVPNGTFRTKIRADNDTDNSFSTLTAEMTISIPDQLPFVNLADWSAPSNTCTDTSTTTTSSTTLDPLTIERNANFEETGIYETNQEREDREYDEYLEELEEEREAEEEAARLAEEQRLNEEREANFNETGILETDDERNDREETEYQAELEANFLETGFYETNDEREEREELEYQIYLEELEAEAEAEILAELEDSIDLETLGLVVVDCIEGDEECENLTDDEIAEIEAELQEFIDTIQEIEENTDFEVFEIEEEVIELEDINIDDDVVVIIIEELEDEEQTDQVPIIEDYDSDEIEEVKEVIEIVEDVIPELPDEILEPEEAEEIIEEFVESLEPETKVEIIEDVVEVGVEELTEEQVVVVQEVVESAIQDVEVLSVEQVETVAEVLGLEESDDVGVIAEAVKTDEAVAEAVESFVERAVENKDVEDYNLSDVVVEVQVEEFLENPAVIFQVDFEEINLVSLGDDLTNQQKEKAQEVVVPVIIASQIISASVVPFRRLN